MFDNHPDYISYPFGSHCGSWFHQASTLPTIKQAVCLFELVCPIVTYLLFSTILEERAMSGKMKLYAALFSHLGLFCEKEPSSTSLRFHSLCSSTPPS